jgi:hypothetical protein
MSLDLPIQRRERLAAVRRLSLLNGPVSDTPTMKRQSFNYKEERPELEQRAVGPPPEFPERDESQN